MIEERELAGRAWGRHGVAASFRFAFRGLIFALRTQRNLRLHAGAAALAVAAGAILDVSRLELLFLGSAIAAVSIAELFNTSIEAAVDLATRSFHPLARIAKDAAAAAVLVASFYAVGIGLLVFGDKLFPLRLRPDPALALAGALPLSALLGAAAILSGRKRRKRRRVPGTNARG